MNYFGSFLLQDMFLNLQVFAFEGQNMTYTVNLLLTCITYEGKYDTRAKNLSIVLANSSKHSRAWCHNLECK